MSEILGDDVGQPNHEAEVHRRRALPEDAWEQVRTGETRA